MPLEDLDRHLNKKKSADFDPEDALEDKSVPYAKLQLYGKVSNDDIASDADIVQTKLSLDDADEDTQGIATFDEDSFTVTDGDVKPKLIAARMYLNSDQDDLTDGTWTVVQCANTSHDYGSNYSVANKYYEIPVTGDYEFSGQIGFESTDMVADKSYTAAIYNGPQATGTQLIQTTIHAARVGLLVVVTPSDIRRLTAGDKIYFYALSGSGDNAIDIDSGEARTFWNIKLIRKA